MLFLFSNELVLSEATEELSPVLQCISTKKKDNCFSRENVLRLITGSNRKNPDAVVSATSGCSKGALRLLVVLLFFSFFLVEVDCKTRDNSSVTNAKIHFQIPLSLSSTLSSLKLPCPTRCRRR